jgi:hypothetical protein
VTIAYAEVFTPGQLSDPDEGRVLIASLSEHVPSWTPYRYGWSEPLRNTYDPERFDHFWSQVGYWRNATRTSEGSVEVRSGPWDILSKVQVSGEWTPELTGEGLGAFLADSGAALDISYGMAHRFTPDERAAYRNAWFGLSPEQDRVKKARQGTMPHVLRDLYWGNVFGPAYVELFGVERLRTAPAAVVGELRPGYFYLQLTADITDRAALAAAREKVKAHLGEECFHDPNATTPRRAPHFATAAEEGLWKPVKGTPMTDELRALLAKAPTDES